MALFCLLGATLGCKNKKAEVVDEVVERPVLVAPGAEGWDELTLSLPQDSPAVIKLEPARFLDAINGGFAWLTRDAAMWGEGAIGEERVNGLLGAREAIFEDFGADLFLAETWSGQGVDLDQPIYLGLYPLSQSGERFVAEVESDLGERVGQGEERTLSESMSTAFFDSVETTGVYSEMARLRRAHQAAIGVRVVLRVNDEAKLLDTIDSIFSDDEYERVAQVEDRSIRRVYFTDRDEDILTLTARAAKEDGVMLLDAFYIPQIVAKGRQERQGEVMAQVAQTLKSTRSGRASAPAPSQEGVVSLGINQQGIDVMLRYVTYRQALELASTSAASERDKETFAQLGRAVWQMNYWDTGARGVDGLNYEFEAGGMYEGRERLFGVEMEIFGDKELTAPQVGVRSFDLGTASSGASVSMDPALFFGEQWKRWLAPMNAQTRIRELLREQFVEEDEVEQDGLQSLFYVLVSPRLLAQFITTAEEEIQQEVPLELMPVYAQRDVVTRFEAILPGLDLSNTFREPNTVFSLSLSRELAPLDRDAFSAALRDTLFYMSNYVSEEGEGGEEGVAAQESYDRAEPMKAGAVRAFDVPAASPLAKTYYYYERDAELPYILIAQGPEARANLEAIRQRGGTQRGEASTAFRMRFEPSAMLQLLNGYDNEELSSFVNLSIMMQRIGPLLLSIKPEQRASGGVLEYRFDLMAPPKL